MNADIPTVITPTRLIESRLSYLEALHESLILAAPEHGFEWVVVVDGTSDALLPQSLREDSRVRCVVTGRPMGAALARNIGLASVQTKWVTSCDDDDLLPEGSLDARVNALLENGDRQWSAGLLCDLFADGSVSVWDCPAPRGLVPAGELWRVWGAPGSVFPLGPTTLLVETSLMRSVGGWQGLPQGEDFGFVMAVSSVAAGVMLDEIVYLYRKHEEQMTKAVGFDLMEPLIREVTFERGRILTEQNS